MNENGQPDVERAVERDLRAYRSRTDRGLPSVEDTARQLRARCAGPGSRDSEEGFWMRSRKLLSARPALTVAGALAIVAVVLGIVPVSYECTTGQDVTLTLPGAGIDPPTVDRIAGQLKNALGAENVSFTMGDGADATAITARVPGGRGAVAQRTAQAFASALGSKGIASRVEVRPVRERVSTSVYAYAMSRVIELRVDQAGRTPAQMEADLRAQLEAAGIRNSKVSVTQQGDQTSAKVEAQFSGPDQGEREIRLELNADGSKPLEAKVQQFEVKRTPGMTDADIKADVERQMREAGVQGEVTVTNGQIEIKVLKGK